MWWNIGRKFAEKDIKLTWQDKDLARELSSFSYLIRNGKILIESKEKIKERLGKSPDRADAYIIGLHTLEKAVVSRNWINWERERDAEVLARASKYTGI